MAVAVINKVGKMTCETNRSTQKMQRKEHPHLVAVLTTRVLLISTRYSVVTVQRIILKWMELKEIEWECVDWINVAQDKDQWRALVSTAMNLRVS
jgi:hypothetical protein